MKYYCGFLDEGNSNIAVYLTKEELIQLLYVREERGNHGGGGDD